jgi:arginine N-succinyltransferase
MHEQFVIRPIRKEDLSAVLALAEKTNPGLTNLLPDSALIEKNILWSLESFEKKPKAPDHELYFFVLEEIKTQKVIGTCGIFSNVGDEFYSFRVSRELVSSEALNMRRENHFLQLVNDYKNVSELGLLLIQKRHRKKGLGKFLSRSRYLFLADHLERFHGHLIAEMRGIIDIWGKSIFWDAVGSRFVDLEFKEVDYLTAANKKHFIPELFPHTPIPVALLSKSAQRAIGAAHPDTAAAVAVLLSEGFEHSNYIDIFDGGPTLETVLKHVRTVAQSQTAKIVGTEAINSGVQCMMSFQGEHYRVSLGEVICHEGGNIEITAKLAETLGCAVGDTVRYIID